MVDVSIVILNYKMRTLVEECLKSIYADIAASSLNVAVVVVDNASNDGLLEWVKETYPTAYTIQSGGNVGFARSVNRGIKEVAASYYFVLNPDTRFVEEKTVHRLHEWMQAHPKVGMAGPRLVTQDGAVQHSCHEFPTLTVQLVRRTPLAEHPFFKRRINKFLLTHIDRAVERPVDWIQGSAMFVRGSVLDQVGLFDERFFMYYEDADWCRRFWKAGLSVYYVPHVAVVHHHNRTSAKVPGIITPLIKNRIAREHLKSWAKYFWKWRTEPLKIF